MSQEPGAHAYRPAHHAAPRKKRKLWPWIAAALAVLAFAGVFTLLNKDAAEHHTPPVPSMSVSDDPTVEISIRPSVIDDDRTVEIPLRGDDD